MTNVEIGRNSQGNSPSLAASISTGYIARPTNWGGPGFDGYVLNMSAGAPGVPAASPSADTGGGTGTPAAAPPAAPTAAPAASPTATPTPGTGGDGAAPGTGTPGTAAAPTPGDTGNAENLRQLRANYEALKAWEKLNQQGLKPDAVLPQITTYQGMLTEASELAATLGYTEDSLAAAMASDPVDTLATLRAEYKQKHPGAADPRAIEQMVRKQVQPITDALNKQQTEQAMQRYEGEIRRLNSDPQIGFGPGVPDEVTNAIWDIMDMVTPEGVLAEVKTKGQVSGLLPHYNHAKSLLLGVINKYNAWQATQAGAAAQATSQGGTGTPAPNRGGGVPAAKDTSGLTLDDIINNVEVLPGVKSGAY